MNKKDKDALQNLQDLQSHPGWIYLTQFMQRNIKDLGEIVLSDTDGSIPEEELRSIIVKRDLQKKLIDLPRNLAQHIMSKEEGGSEATPEFDVYDNNY